MERLIKHARTGLLFGVAASLLSGCLLFEGAYEAKRDDSCQNYDRPGTPNVPQCEGHR